MKTIDEAFINLSKELGKKVYELMLDECIKEKLDVSDMQILSIVVLKTLLDTHLELIRQEYGQEALDSALNLLTKINKPISI